MYDIKGYVRILNVFKFNLNSWSSFVASISALSYDILPHNNFISKLKLFLRKVSHNTICHSFIQMYKLLKDVIL